MNLEENRMSDITLTDEQFGAVKVIKKWFSSKSERKIPFILAGLAGTGKTSIAKHIIDDLKLKEYQVRYCSFTGKATMVMRNKGMPATTIHKLIYEPKTGKDNKVYFVKKYTLDKNIKLIVCDESSMVGKTIQQDLESFNVPILYIGDHGQLPPVSEDITNLMLKPNYKLETIHRQALDNPIIWIANQARLGNIIKYSRYGDTVLKAPKEKITINTLKNADQILCGKNVTRQNMNFQLREFYGFTSTYPEINDKLICLRNDNGTGLINGMIGKCIRFDETKNKLDFESDENDFFQDLSIDYKIFEGKTTEYNKKIQQFDYSYCVTTHKFQGSQANNVIVYEERLGDHNFHKKWLYTAITRASERLVIIG